MQIIGRFPCNVDPKGVELVVAADSDPEVCIEIDDGEYRVASFLTRMGARRLAEVLNAWADGEDQKLKDDPLRYGKAFTDLLLRSDPSLIEGINAPNKAKVDPWWEDSVEPVADLPAPEETAVVEPKPVPRRCRPEIVVDINCTDKTGHEHTGPCMCGGPICQACQSVERSLKEGGPPNWGGACLPSGGTRLTWKIEDLNDEWFGMIEHIEATLPFGVEITTERRDPTEPPLRDAGAETT